MTHNDSKLSAPSGTIGKGDKSWMATCGQPPNRPR